MPFTIRTTYSFYGQSQGWSESFYWSSADGNLANAQAIVTPIAQKRARLLANGYVLQVIRNSVVIDASGAKVLRQSDLIEPNYTGVAAWMPASPNLALMFTWQNAANTLSKKLFMRGIPSGIGDNGKVADFTGTGAPAFYSYMQQWIAAMLALPAGWLVQQTTQNLVINSYEIDAVTAQVTFTLSVPGGFGWPVSFGYPIRVWVKIPGKSPLDGPITVIPTSTTSCFTPGSHPSAPLPTGQLGTMQLKTPSLVTLAPVTQGGPTGSIDPQRIVTHTTGRPTYASRGRAAKKVLW